MISNFPPFPKGDKGGFERHMIEKAYKSKGMHYPDTLPI